MWTNVNGVNIWILFMGRNNEAWWIVLIDNKKKNVELCVHALVGTYHAPITIQFIYVQWNLILFVWFVLNFVGILIIFDLLLHESMLRTENENYSQFKRMDFVFHSAQALAVEPSIWVKADEN